MQAVYKPQLPTRRHTADTSSSSHPPSPSSSASLSKPIYLINTPTGVRPRDAPDSSDCKPIDPPPLLTSAQSTFSRTPTMMRRRSYEASLAPSDSISQVSDRRYQKQYSSPSPQQHSSSSHQRYYSQGGGHGNVIVLNANSRATPQRGQTYHSYTPQQQQQTSSQSRGRVVYVQSGGGSGKHSRSQSVPRTSSSPRYHTESPRGSSPSSPTKYIINGRTYTVMPSQGSRSHSGHSTSGTSVSKESMSHRIRRLLGMNSGKHAAPPASSSRFIQW